MSGAHASRGPVSHGPISHGNEGFVVELRRGTGNPPFLTFGQGSELPPTSVGLHGDWRVEADGILDVHAFLYFDGAQLFLQSADMRNAVRVNGKPIGADWSPIEAPCTIAMGDARLVYCPASQASAISSPPDRSAKPKVASNRVSTRPASPRASSPAIPAQGPAQGERFDEDAATMMNMPGVELPRQGRAPAAHGAGASALSSDDLDEATGSIPLPHGKPLDEAGAPQAGMYEEDVPTTRAQMGDMDGETTRALPLPAIAGGPGRGHAPAPPRPMAPMPHIPPMTMPVVMPRPGAPPLNADASQGPIAAPPAAAPTGPAKVSPLVQLKAQWKEASLPKKAIALLLPLAFVMVIFGLDDPPTPPPKSATATSSASATAKAKEPKTKEPKTKEPESEPAPTVAAKAEPATKPEPVPKAEPKPEPTPKGKDIKGSSPSTTGSTKTPERAAIDSIAAGAYDPAAKQYEELAKQHPDNPAYKEAARILKAKAGPKK